MVLILGLGALGRAASRSLRRVEVLGASMAPTLEEGDRLLVVALPRRWPLYTGQLVAVVDPRDGPGGRLLVKRIASVGPSGLQVVGEPGAASTDSRDFGPVAREGVVGLALYRYAPAGRTGRLR